MYFLTTQVNSTAADEDEWETPNSLDALEPLLTEEACCDDCGASVPALRKR